MTDLSLISVTKEEFFKVFPPEERNIKINGEVICNLGEDIVCDQCNADVITEENPVEVYMLVETHPDGEKRILQVLCRECLQAIMEENRKRGTLKEVTPESVN